MNLMAFGGADCTLGPHYQCVFKPSDFIQTACSQRLVGQRVHRATMIFLQQSHEVAFLNCSIKK